MKKEKNISRTRDLRIFREDWKRSTYNTILWQRTKNKNFSFLLSDLRKKNNVSKNTVKIQFPK